MRPLARVDVSPPSTVRIVARPDRIREIELRVEATNDSEAARALDAIDVLGRLALPVDVASNRRIGCENKTAVSATWCCDTLFQMGQAMGAADALRS
jgi:hypothetical protein